ncbi:MAG: ATPase domain-containing protein [Candidatus Bathyarchaeia archaeon]
MGRAELVVLITSTLLVLVYVFGQADHVFILAFSNTVAPVAAFAAFLAAYLAGRVFRRSDLGAIFNTLALGLLFWFLGEFTWAFYTLALNVETPYPSLADVFWLAGYVPLGAGLYMVFKASGFTQSVAVKAMSLLAAIAVGLFAAYFLVLPAMDRSSQDLGALFLDLAYPTLDVVLFLFAFGLLATLSGTRLGWTWFPVPLGIFMNILADMAFSWLTAFGEYEGANPIDVVWVLADLLFIYGFHKLSVNTRGFQRLFERLMSSDVKAELLTLFHEEPCRRFGLEEVAQAIGKQSEEVEKDLKELVEMGLLVEEHDAESRPLFSLRRERDEELEELSLSKLGRAERPEEKPLRGLELPKATGVEALDMLLPSGIRQPSAVLILGDSGTGKPVLCRQLVAAALKMKEPVVYLATDDFPDRIREGVVALAPGLEPEVLFVDCYSSYGAAGREAYSEDLSDLSGVTVALLKAIGKKAKGTPGLAVIDSLSTIIHKCGVKSSREFLRAVIAKTRESRFSLFVTLGRSTFHPAIVASFRDMVDCVIEMKMEEEPMGLYRYIRVSMREDTRQIEGFISLE